MLCSNVFAANMVLPTTELHIGGYTVYAQMAATPASRTRGLMHRDSLAPDHGMLFIFEKPDHYCFWMKNTPLPLSIAFIDKDGVIVNISDMQPNSLVSHCAHAPVLYALETEQGWFKGKRLQAGQAVTGLPAISAR